MAQVPSRSVTVTAYYGMFEEESNGMVHRNVTCLVVSEIQGGGLLCSIFLRNADQREERVALDNVTVNAAAYLITTITSGAGVAVLDFSENIQGFSAVMLLLGGFSALGFIPPPNGLPLGQGRPITDTPTNAEPQNPTQGVDEEPTTG